MTKNIKIWRSESSSSDWFLEPDHGACDEAWTEHVFDSDGDLYYRGQLLLTSLDGAQQVEPRLTPNAIAFSNGKERSIFDLGGYIAGVRDDGAIVFQTEVTPLSTPA